MVEGYIFSSLLLASTNPTFFLRQTAEDTRAPNAGTRAIRMATPGELHLAMAGDANRVAGWTRSKALCKYSQGF